MTYPQLQERPQNHFEHPEQGELCWQNFRTPKEDAWCYWSRYLSWFEALERDSSRGRIKIEDEWIPMHPTRS